MIVPAYGPNWRHKVPRMNPFLWHVQAIHHPIWRKIRVAPYNYKRRPKRSTKRR